MCIISCVDTFCQNLKDNRTLDYDLALICTYSPYSQINEVSKSTVHKYLNGHNTLILNK